MPLVLPKLFINNQVIKRQLSIKFLGIQLDENLLWKEHLKLTENKVVLKSCSYFTKKDPAAYFKLVLLVLNENKISKPKRRRRAFKTRRRVFKHAAECLDSIYFNFCFCLKTKQNVAICHGANPFLKPL